MASGKCIGHLNARRYRVLQFMLQILSYPKSSRKFFTRERHKICLQKRSDWLQVEKGLSQLSHGHFGFCFLFCFQEVKSYIGCSFSVFWFYWDEDWAWLQVSQAIFSLLPMITLTCDISDCFLRRLFCFLYCVVCTLATATRMSPSMSLR